MYSYLLLGNLRYGGHTSPAKKKVCNTANPENSDFIAPPPTKRLLNTLLITDLA